MAYPFPRIALVPQTPQYLQGIESPRNKKSRKSQSQFLSIAAYKRTVMIVIFIIAILLWLIYPSSSPSSKQADRIPFTRDLVDECEEPLYNDKCKLIMFRTAISHTSKATRTAASCQQICTAHQLGMNAVGRFIPTARTVLLFSKQ